MAVLGRRALWLLRLLRERSACLATGRFTVL